MTVDEIEGIVVNDIDYGETSKIITVLSPNGIIGVMAKGCKNVKSTIRTCADKLTFGKFYIKYKEGKLSTLNNFDNYGSFRNIRKDITKLSYAMYLLDLSYQVAKENFSNLIYEILISGIKKIDEGFDAAIITNIIELKYLSLLGVMPVLDECAVCGSKNGIVALSSDKGGYVCNKCFNNDLVVSSKTIKLIRMYYYIDIDKISSLNINKGVSNEINRFIDLYYDKYTGLYLNSKKFAKDLN